MPHVAGAVAVIRGQDNTLTIDEIITALTNAGEPVTDTRNNISTPRLNLYEALSTNNLLPPTANFSASPTSGGRPLNVVFTDASTDNPTSWSWSFGDGGTSAERNPVHTYKQPGTYSVTLTASNAFGSSTITQTNLITVYSCSQQPVRLRNASTYYSSIQAAYNAAGNGETIECQALDFSENLVFSVNKSVTIKGGYNCEYTNNLSMSTLNGSVSINSGIVTLGDFVIQ